MKQYYEYSIEDLKIIKAIDSIAASELGCSYIKIGDGVFDYLPPVQYTMRTLRSAVSSINIDESLNIGGLVIKTDGRITTVDFDPSTASKDVPSVVFMALDSAIHAEAITRGNITIVIDNMISVSAVATEISEGDWEVKIKYSPAKDLKILCKRDIPPCN